MSTWIFPRCNTLANTSQSHSRKEDDPPRLVATMIYPVWRVRKSTFLTRYLVNRFSVRNALHKGDDKPPPHSL